MQRFPSGVLFSIIILSRVWAANGLAASWRRSANRIPILRQLAAARMESSTRKLLQIPKIDDRIYCQYVLSNGVPVTLVQDKRSEKSSCALSVKTGAMHDPLPGIAHITEHAVFLGSEKYPIENAYKDFLNKNGGGSNAGTTMDQTTYKFNVNSDAFDNALDLFSQFFKGPLFRTEAMCREVMAVDSEDSKNRIIDSRRLLQVLKHQVDPSSQYAKFSTGNLKTLVYNDVEKYGEHLSNTIRSFHQRYYHPASMAVVLVGPQSIDQLRDLADRHFSDITGTTVGEDEAALPLPPTVREVSLFSHSGGKLIRLRPVKDLRDMTVVWELPATVDLYRRDPCYLISYLLGNKGEGSWFAALQDRQWATSTSAGVRTQFTDFTLFEATVSLTEEGLQHWEEVMALLYRSIEAVRLASDAELSAYWAEMRTIHALDFQYRQKNTPYELAPQLASNMLDFPAEHILSVGWLMDEQVDLPQVRAFLARLVADKSLVFLRCKSFVDGPHNLGGDDATYLHERAFTEYDAHVRALAQMEAAAQTMDLNSSTSLEVSKLSGEDFRQLRAHQDAEYAATVAASKGTASTGVQRMEPFYGIPYLIEDLATAQRPAAVVTKNVADAHIALPQPNRFLCTELIDDTHIRDDNDHDAETQVNGETVMVEDVRPKRSAPPVPVPIDVTDSGVAELDRKQVWLWHSRDEVFRQPRSVFFHCMRSRACEDGHPVLSLMSQVFSQVSARKYYQPAVAGLSYSLNIGSRGVGLSVRGYSPRLVDFAAEVSRDVGDLAFWSAISPAVVEMVKDRLLRAYRSWAKERPDAQCDSLLRYLLHEGTWLPQDRLQACETIDTAYFQHRVASVLQFDNVLSYAHGDCTAETAVRCHRTVAANIRALNRGVVRTSAENMSASSDPGLSATATATATTTPVREVPSERSRLLQAGDHHVVALPALNREDPNSALLTFFQAEHADPAVSARVLLLRRLLGEPAFTELRTKQQLGYIVSLSPSGYGTGWNAVRGISVRILSKRASPLAMETALMAFLDAQRDLLHSTLTDEIVQERCRTIIQSLEDPPTTYAEEASDYWDSIVHDLPFDWTERVIDQLCTLDREKLLQTADDWLFEPTTRRVVSMMLFAPEHEQERRALMDATAAAVLGEGDVQEGQQATVSGEVGAGKKYTFSIDGMTRLRDTLPFVVERGAHGVNKYA